MNTSPDKPTRFPFFRRVFRALFSRKALYVLIALTTLIALFYAEENFRGKRAWDRYRRQAEARGAVLDFMKTVPPEIPAAENAASTRFIQSWFAVGRGWETNPLAQVYSNMWPRWFAKANERNLLPKQFRNKGQDDRHLTDLVVWQKVLAIVRTNGSLKSDENDSDLLARIPRDPAAQPVAARAVLDALKDYQAAIEELRTASQKPRVRYPVVYKNDDPFSILLPHLARIKQVSQVLKLQASAELAAGQTGRAFEDVRLMLWLCDSLEHETFIISQLVRISCQQIASVPIWEGLVEHKWSDAQLKEIEERCLRANFAAEMDRSIESERSGSIAFALNVIKRNNLGQVLDQLGSWENGMQTQDGPKRFVAAFIPRGWVYLEMLNHSSLLDGLVAGGWDAKEKSFHLQQVGTNEEEFKFHLNLGWKAILHHQVLANLTLPALTKASTRYARGQNTANQIALACALERYRITKGSYPDALAVLAPQFIAAIPNEVVSTAPMRYSQKGDGYVLYSAGSDGIDDGGAFSTPAKRGDSEKGDWVWRVPALE